MSVAAFRLKYLDNTVCIVVGLGLAGSGVCSYLSLLGSRVREEVKPTLNWNRANSVFNAINQFLLSEDHQNIELIWCAGRAGFAATDSELELENRVFIEVIERLKLARRNLVVSILSSAGGLHEGSGGARHVTDPLTPLRPYAKWKVKQEQYLQKALKVSRIFRVSTIYGVTPGRSRRGIINALLESAYTNNAALVYARPSTLRDYVSNREVGRHLVSRLGANDSLVELVVSGRAASIDMLANFIKRATHRHPKVIYYPNSENARDIVFTDQSASNGFKSSSLEEGILHTLSAYRMIKFASGY